MEVERGFVYVCHKTLIHIISDAYCVFYEQATSEIYAALRASN